MAREIKLSGGEITLLKAVGLSGASVPGKRLLEQMGEMETAEFLDDLNGLIMMGYVLASKVNIGSREDVERSFFRVNANYTRDLRESINPGRHKREERRRRRG